MVDTETIGNNLSTIDLDYKICNLETTYETLNTKYEDVKSSLRNSTSHPQYHLLLYYIRSISKILFLLQRKLQLASTDLKQRRISVEEKIRNYRKETYKRKKRPKTFSIFTPTKPNLSFYFQYDGTRWEKDNLDYNEIQQSGHQLLCHFPSPKRWRECDKQKLYDFIRQSIIKEQSQKLINRLSTLYDLIKSESNVKQLNILQKCCEKIVDKMSRIKNYSLKELLTSFPNSEFEWQIISEQWFRKKFTEQECRTMWYLVAYPSVINKRWSKAEDLFLNSLASRYNCENWDLICDKLNNGRTPFLCFIRYKNYFNNSNRKTPKVYSVQENELVNEFIDKRYQNEYDFSNLLSKVKDIDCKQLKTHINHVVSSKGKLRGRFNVKDRFLIHFYAKKGHSNKKISQLLRNRTPKQVYDFQLNSRFQSVNRKWTYREIRKLLMAVKYNGARRWREISKYLQNRSANSCNRKYRWLVSKYPNLVEVYSKKTPSIKDIKLMLRDRQNVTSTIDDEIEAYFVDYLEKQPSSSRDIDSVSVANNVIDILKFLGLNVNQNISEELLSEIGEWLLNFDKNDPNEPGPSNFTEVFGNLNSGKKNLKMTKNSTFTHVVPKSCPVLPPNKCTMYGLDTFKKNLQKCCSTADVDLSVLWNNINSANIKNKEFVEAKILFYRIFKGLFYWPIKLDTLSLDEFL